MIYQYLNAWKICFNLDETPRLYLMDLGYIEFQLVKHGGKVYSAYRINPLDSSGMFIDKDNEHTEENYDNSVAEFNYNVVDNSVDNVVDNVVHRCSTATHPATQTATVYIDKKEKEKIKKVKKEEDDDDGQLQVLCDAYEDYRQKPVSPKDRQKISTYLSEYGFDAMLEAMEIMIQKKAASIDYCGGILKNMHKDMQKQKEEAIADGWQLA